MKSKRWWALPAALPMVALAVAIPNDPVHAGSATTAVTPIRHVVVIYQEHHSFDNALGALCVRDARCDGSTVGKLSDGSGYRLTMMPDIVPRTVHDTKGQATAIDAGKMDGWDHVANCRETPRYQCLAQYDPDSGQNGTASPIRTSRRWPGGSSSPIGRSETTYPVVGRALELVAQDLDGFTGNNPVRGTDPSLRGHNGGCASVRTQSGEHRFQAGSRWCRPACLISRGGALQAVAGRLCADHHGPSTTRGSELEDIWQDHEHLGHLPGHL